MSQKLRYRGLDSSGEGNDGEEEEHLLSEKNEEEEEEEDRYLNSSPRPWKAIILAVFLALVGIFMLLLYICSCIGVITFQPASSISFLLLALITIIPGGYHVHHILRAYFGYDGYNLADLPDLN